MGAGRAARANASHAQLASRSSSTNDARSMSLNTAISVYAAMASSARLNTEPHVTRRSRMSGCSGAPSSVRSRPRTSSSSMSVVVQRVAHRARHRRLLDVRQHGQQPVVAEGRAAPPRRPAPRRRAAARRVSTWARSCSMSDWSAATDADERSPNPIVPSARATRRSRSMRPWAMPASWRRSRSRHSAVDRRVVGRPGPRPQRHAVGPDDDEGVALPGAAGRDEPGHAHAGPLGEQRDEPLVLDELEAAQAHGALGVAVPGQPPDVGEQLAVPRVAPVDLDRQRPVVGRCRRTAASPRGASTPAPARRRSRRGLRAPAGCATSSGGRPASRRRGGRRPRRAGRWRSAAMPPVAVVAPRNSEPTSCSPMSQRPKWRNGRREVRRRRRDGGRGDRQRARAGTPGGPSTSANSRTTLHGSSCDELADGDGDDQRDGDRRRACRAAARAGGGATAATNSTSAHTTGVQNSDQPQRVEEPRERRQEVGERDVEVGADRGDGRRRRSR